MFLSEIIVFESLTNDTENKIMKNVIKLKTRDPLPLTRSLEAKDHCLNHTTVRHDWTRIISITS